MSDSIYKKLVNALFKLSGGQAMPQSQYTETTSATYIAPADGWVIFSFQTQSDNNPWYIVYINSIPFFNIVGSAFIGGGSLAFVPVKKGDIVSQQGGNGSTKLTYFRFFKTVGGGN